MCPANGTDTIPISDPTATAIGPIDRSTITVPVAYATARELKRYEPPFSAIRSPMPRSTLGSECPKISRIGCSEICSCFSKTMNVGLSRSLIRMNIGDQDQQDRRQERDPP